jgi:prepilin-type N-terminal cleavage/methylation domain-containing protein
MILRPTSARGGFTLVEMIISAGLMSVILTSAYLCLNAGVAGKKLIEQRADAVQSARVALNLIAADLRAAIPLNPKLEFLGMRRTEDGADADNLDFATRNYTPRNAREPDYCEISYFLTPDPASGSYILMRRRDPTPDPEPLEGGFREEIARGVAGLRFEYYDGFEWFDEWGDLEGKYKGMMYPPSNSYGIPVAIRVTISFDQERRKRKSATTMASSEVAEDSESPAPPMTFQTIARLDLEPMFSRQTVSQNNESSETSTQAAPEGGPQ